LPEPASAADDVLIDVADVIDADLCPSPSTSN